LDWTIATFFINKRRLDQASSDEASKPLSAEQVEPARPRAELVRAEMELDIVKKAAAYCARELK
jgi:transposase-like protein